MENGRPMLSKRSTQLTLPLAIAIKSRFGRRAPLLSQEVSEPDLAHAVRGRSASSDVSSNISPSPLYIPPHRC